jgi:UDP-N-acetylmuramoyl-tripeptide--D-alanyl-D-alanine ligase
MSKIKITLEDIFNIPGAVIYNPDEYKSAGNVSYDTRNIKKGSIFFAIKGNNFDGHSFVKEAFKQGAVAAFINKNRVNDFGGMDGTLIAVKDTTVAYGDLANVWRNKLSAKVIGITGSNGKTTTKEILSSLLAEKYKVVKTLSNNNNHLGVPLTIFSANDKTEVLVLELGTNHFGEIAYTAKIAEPDLALITNIGDSHLEFLKDRKGVLNEKKALFDETIKKDGKIFINRDDALLQGLYRAYKNRKTFSMKKEADFTGSLIEYCDSGRTLVEIKKGSKSVKLTLPLYGLSNAKNFVAAAAAASELGLSLTQIKNGAGNLKSVDKRLNVMEKNVFMLVNDSYNANPESMKSALEFINKIKTYHKRIAILGDMYELGEETLSRHKELADSIMKNRIDEVYTIGKFMKTLYSELQGKHVESRHFANREKLSSFLTGKDFNDSVILVKGSRGMKMEEFAKIIEGK